MGPVVRVVCAGLLIILAALSGAGMMTSLAMDIMNQPAVILVETDGHTATVNTEPGDAAYPIASSVEVVHDDLGSVLTVKVRLVPVFDERVYLPVIRGGP